MNDFDLLFANHSQIDLYYLKLPSIAGVLVLDEDIPPSQRKKTSKLLERVPKGRVYICTKKSDDAGCSGHNIILNGKNFKNETLLKLNSPAEQILGGNTGILENKPPETFKEKLDKASTHRSTVLLVGETGSGKTYSAAYIHDHSPFKNKPFCKESVTSMGSNLIESSLFGTTRGAFTSAENKKGLLETADGGTFCLDEIDALSPETQSKLLRFFDDKKFRKLGSTEEITCNARLILTTNVDLQAQMKAGLFRSDLFYRIKVCVIRIPPLRERKDEIESLATHFAAQFGKKISSDAIDKLKDYSWPGNIRELKNAIEASSVSAENNELSAEDIIRSLSA